MNIQISNKRYIGKQKNMVNRIKDMRTAIQDSDQQNIKYSSDFNKARSRMWETCTSEICGVDTL